MGEPKFTPAPWTLSPEFGEAHGQFSVVGSDGAEIAAVEAWIGTDRPEATANAHLIAAAPALFEALTQVCDDLRCTDWACQRAARIAKLIESLLMERDRLREEIARGESRK